MSQPTGNPQWDDAAALAGMRSVLDPGDVGGARNRVIDSSQKVALKRALRPVQGMSVLDIGCGIGRITTWLQTGRAHAIGADSSAGMLAVARRNAPTAMLARASASALPFRDESFDAIVSVFVLQYLVRDADVFAGALTECRRVLRPGSAITAIEQVNNGDRECGGKLDAYVDGLAEAGFVKVSAIPARLSDSRILGQVSERPFLGRTPGIGALVGREARSRRGRPVTERGYADYLLVARTRG